MKQGVNFSAYLRASHQQFIYKWVWYSFIRALEVADATNYATDVPCDYAFFMIGKKIVG